MKSIQVLAMARVSSPMISLSLRFVAGDRYSSAMAPITRWPVFPQGNVGVQMNKIRRRNINLIFAEDRRSEVKIGIGYLLFINCKI